MITTLSVLFYAIATGCSWIAWRHWRAAGIPLVSALGLRRDALEEVLWGAGIGTVAIGGVFVVLLLGRGRLGL